MKDQKDMTEFFLFRLKLEFSVQASIFDTGEIIDKPTLIRAAISEKPSAEIRKNISWHIGNFEEIDSNGIFFLLGKDSQLSTSVYDENEGNFKEDLIEQAPYTQVFIDNYLQLCAISKKNIISPKIRNIANNLANLLNKSKISFEKNFKFVLSQINNPDDFLEDIQNAYRVTKFVITLSKPNPFDADEDFHKPLKRLLQETNSDHGKTELNGQDLDRDNISKITKSVSTSGDKASARLLQNADEKARSIHLGNNPARLLSKHEEVTDYKKETLLSIRKLYFQIRGDGEKEL